jgi:hypothetical protein
MLVRLGFLGRVVMVVGFVLATMTMSMRRVFYFFVRSVRVLVNMLVLMRVVVFMSMCCVFMRVVMLMGVLMLMLMAMLMFVFFVFFHSWVLSSVTCKRASGNGKTA